VGAADFDRRSNWFLTGQLDVNGLTNLNIIVLHIYKASNITCHFLVLFSRSTFL
jgi:hypothetical protein